MSHISVHLQAHSVINLIVSEGDVVFVDCVPKITDLVSKACRGKQVDRRTISSAES